ncbi:protein fam89a [Lasius niger]|uniref:Protein fam89a n=1 Tax=Lasius niger TaxID=67767 RepID=A0A0J7L436_LASNI|nr:protein fam89a [Lasius niger]
MQLATSQRPHPPPVPPRPSRQVVAEALKRSPRPPCPTRQAPPPPNMKPWRSNQQQQQHQAQQQQQVDPTTAGRTIVYESIKEDCKDESALDDMRDRKQARNTIDKNAEDNRPENGGKNIASSHEHHEICTNISSGKLYPTGNVPANVVRKRNSLTEDQRPQQRLETRRNSRGKDPVGLSDLRGRSRASPGKDQRKESATERVEATSTKLPAVARTVNVSLEENRHRASFSSSPDSAGRQVTVSHPEKCNGSPERETDDEQVRSTPTCRSCPGEQQQQQQQKQHPEIFSAKGKAAGNDGAEAVSSIERSTNVPSVDRAATTVLVKIDEPERKIALSDHEDNNDDDDDDNDGDNNIHRQDWLEAGVHYSSTQITLHGDDIVDGDHRINGYDHREEERITDLDFIR